MMSSSNADTKSAPNVFNPKFDTDGIIGDLGGVMDPMPLGETTTGSSSAGTGGVSSPINRTALALVRYYAMYLFSQMTVENARASFSSVRAQVTESGFLSITAFSIPKQTEIVSRLQGNLKTFWVPYGCIYGIVAAWSVMTSPWLLLSLFTIFSVYMFLFKIHANQNVKFGEYNCDGTQKTMFFTVLSVFIFVFSGFLSYLLSIILWGSCIVVTHAALHKLAQPVLPIDAADAVPLTGPPSIE